MSAAAAAGSDADAVLAKATSQLKKELSSAVKRAAASAREADGLRESLERANAAKGKLESLCRELVVAKNELAAKASADALRHREISDNVRW